MIWWWSMCLCVPGLNSPDTALYEGLKLLCSLLVTLVGKGLYGAFSSSSDTRFIYQGRPFTQIIGTISFMKTRLFHFGSYFGAVWLCHNDSPPLPFTLRAGDNLVLKWQLLSELLGCSLKMVTIRSNSGAIHEAKLQCLEALKLATKLQTLSQYVHGCGVKVCNTL